MSARFLMMFLVASTLVLGACQEKTQQSAPVLLKVGERAITVEEFRSDFARIVPDREGLSEEDLSELRRAYLRQILERELTLSEAERLGIRVSSAELERQVHDYRSDYPADEFARMLEEQGLTFEQWRDDLRERLLMEKVIEKQVHSRLSVNDAEIETYYEQAIDRFDRPEQVRARQIIVASEEEGQQVLGLLRQGERFADVARRHSLSADAEQGGDLGFFARGEMPPQFDEVVFSLPPGRLSDVVKSDYGYHVFRVEEKRPAERLKLEQVRERIRSRLLEDKEDEAYRKWLLGLSEQAKIEVDWTLLNEGEPTERQKD